MKKGIIGLAVLLSLFGALTLAQKSVPATPENKQKEQKDTPKVDETTLTVRAFLKSYVEAFNKQDLEALKKMWKSDCTYVDHSTGERSEGSKPILTVLEETFKKQPQARLSGRVDEARAITPDVVQVSGETTVMMPNELPSSSLFSAILVKKNGEWVFASVEEKPVPEPETLWDALSELEWLLGKWIDASDEARVETTFRWASNGAFILRSYVVEDSDGGMTQGTQVIGWDPRSKQIRSWSFDSNGSFGDEVWTKNDGDWLIRASRTLADGRAASGTYVLSKITNDSFTVQLIGHEIEGELMPTREPVKVVRAPEKKTEEKKTEEKKPEEKKTEEKK